MSVPVLVVPATARELAGKASRARGEEPEPVRVTRGDTWRHPFLVVDRETGAAVDVTGWTFWFTAKVAYPLPDARAQIALDNIVGGSGGVTLPSPTQGQGLATVQPGVTRQYPDGPVHLLYDIQAADASYPPVITTVERGVLVVEPDVTRAITS